LACRRPYYRLHSYHRPAHRRNIDQERSTSYRRRLPFGFRSHRLGAVARRQDGAGPSRHKCPARHVGWVGMTRRGTFVDGVQTPRSPTERSLGIRRELKAGYSAPSGLGALKDGAELHGTLLTPVTRRCCQFQAQQRPDREGRLSK
jgi:hypothetical protein